MTNEDMISDLKQFITATVKQEGSLLRDDLNNSFAVRVGSLEDKLNALDTKIDDVDSKLDTILEAVGDKFEDHEQRITKLESQPA